MVICRLNHHRRPFNPNNNNNNNKSTTLVTVAVIIAIVVLFLFHSEIAHHLVFSRNCQSHHYPINNIDYNEPIDVVYTWVNGSDTQFRQQLDYWLVKEYGVAAAATARRRSSAQRFDDKNELKYSLRSLARYAPWINHIYIVTNGQIPYWLNLDRVTLISHDQIFPNQHDLPTFSSPAIELHLHRIPGLSKKFIYFNDDIFLNRPVFREDFYTPNRGYLIYLAWLVPMCAKDCSWIYVADGSCDEQCNNVHCQMDGGDCNDDNLDEDGGGNKKMIIEGVNNNPNILQTYYMNDSTNKIPHYQNRDSFYHKILLGNFNVSSDLKNNNTNEKYNKNKTIDLNNISPIRTNITQLIRNHNKHFIAARKRVRKQRRHGISNIKTTKKKQLLFFERIVAPRSVMGKEQQYDNDLIDAYSASLQHTNRVLNRCYGFAVRRVPAHAPILIDRDVMYEMQDGGADAINTLMSEVMLTSRNRFRSPNDLQFAFIYYYYLIHETIRVDIGTIFDRFDTDLSGIWSEIEIETLIAQLFDLPLTNDEAINELYSVLLSCFRRSKVNSEKLEITKDLITNCKLLRELLVLKFGIKSKYDHELISTTPPNDDDDVVWFKMLNSNVSDVRAQLHDIRKYPRKFICLNDNLDESRPSNNALVRGLLHDLYESLFPLASPFELNVNYRNQFQYVSDYMMVVRKRQYMLLFVTCVVLLIVGVFLRKFMRRQVCLIVNKYYYCFYR